MKIATMATGGIGGYLAVGLTKAGHDVATIARGAHLDAIKANGLTLETDSGSTTVQPWIATDDPSEAGPVDAVIFGVKGGALEAAAQATKPLIGPDTIVIPFLNGVEAVDRLMEILPHEAVGNGTAQVSTTIAEPGLIRQTGAFNRFAFAERDNRPSQRIDALRAAIIEAGAEAPVVDDIDRELWIKFVLFSAMSGVTAAARCRLGDILSSEALSGLFRGVMAETAGLARALNVSLPDGAENIIWERVQTMPAEMRASTAVDLERGMPLEIDWLSGAVARLSEGVGLEASRNATIHALLTPYRDGR